MRNYVEIGPAPCAEECAQVGQDGYWERSRVECRRFIAAIRTKLGLEPDGARLAAKSFPHDFGSYLEVVCYYDDDNEGAEEYAFRCEAEAPEHWLAIPEVDGSQCMTCQHELEVAHEEPCRGCVHVAGWSTAEAGLVRTESRWVARKGEGAASNEVEKAEAGQQNGQQCGPGGTVEMVVMGEGVGRVLPVDGELVAAPWPARALPVQRGGLRRRCCRGRGAQRGAARGGGRSAPAGPLARRTAARRAAACRAVGGRMMVRCGQCHRLIPMSAELEAQIQRCYGPYEPYELCESCTNREDDERRRRTGLDPDACEAACLPQEW